MEAEPDSWFGKGTNRVMHYCIRSSTGYSSVRELDQRDRCWLRYVLCGLGLRTWCEGGAIASAAADICPVCDTTWFYMI